MRLLSWIRDRLEFLLSNIYSWYSDWMDRRERKKLEKVSYPTDRIVISCDASITVNPGGRSAVGAVIRIPGRLPIHFSRHSIGKTNNEAEHEAVFHAIESVATLHYRKCDLPVDIYSDSMLVVKQLEGKWKCKTEPLRTRRDASWEYFRLFPEVRVTWKRRNSTEDLKFANNSAQKLNGLVPH